ncbi:hypothetical protein [Microvirga rosea]|uniref:hypothetical protein n=1 Tax=Microvirga rosea TaxID=2715425 RepID=UPI001D0BD224|nr:hypothetical protein [Microvirga rosea]MCB8823133.1 hypothetical protein [Microvirga rosea]
MPSIGDLKRQGFDGLEITCEGCGFIVITWWNLLKLPEGQMLSRIAPKFKCQRCGARAKSVEPYRRGQEAPSPEQMGVSYRS